MGIALPVVFPLPVAFDGPAMLPAGACPAFLIVIPMYELLGREADAAGAVEGPDLRPKAKISLARSACLPLVPIPLKSFEIDPACISSRGNTLPLLAIAVGSFAIFVVLTNGEGYGPFVELVVGTAEDLIKAERGCTAF